MSASYLQRKRLRELHSELSAVQNRIRQIDTPGRREVKRLERAGYYRDASLEHEEMVNTLQPLWKEQTRLERQIDEAGRRL